MNPARPHLVWVNARPAPLSPPRELTPRQAGKAALFFFVVAVLVAALWKAGVLG